LRNQHIGFVFQSFNLIPDLDVWDNVEVPLRYRKLGGADRRRRIDEVLERVGLTSRSSYLPSQLSGGQQQRVAIARALVGKPDLILADEPTGNLDSLIARQVMDLFQQISEAGTTIVVVTHSQEYAAASDLAEAPRVLNRDQVDIRRYYPKEALQRGLEGEVVLRVTIDSDGSIAEAVVVRDPGEGLGAAALRAVREFRFAPGRVGASPVATAIPFVIRFVIS
jgi:TonB family protein